MSSTQGWLYRGWGCGGLRIFFESTKGKTMAKGKRVRRASKSASEAIRRYLARKIIDMQRNWSASPSRADFQHDIQKELQNEVNSWKPLGQQLWGDKKKPKAELLKDAFSPSSISKHLKEIGARDTVTVSPFATPFHHMYFVEIQLDNVELREILQEPNARDDFPEIADRSRPHESILNVIINTITNEEFEGIPYSHHIAISNGYVVHGRDRVLHLLVYTDDGMYTLGHLVRDVLLVTPPVSDVRTFVVGYNLAYDGYSGDTRGTRKDSEHGQT